MTTLNLPVVLDGFDHYMTRIKKFDLLSREEEYELAQRYHQSGDLEAAHRLICCNLRFVVKIAHEYRNYGMKLLDLIQEGNIGLIRITSYNVCYTKLVGERPPDRRIDDNVAPVRILLHG